MDARIERDIARGRIVCPVTRAALTVGEGALQAPGRAYRLAAGGVPLLLEDEAAAARYASTSARMNDDYAHAARPTLWQRLRALGYHDYHAPAARRAFAHMVSAAPPDGTLVSIGGGPSRAHPALTNLNIGPFPNVDIVADAYRLPYADGAIDGIDCQAVLEHLADPVAAVGEMHRALKPGGLAYVATPFMQAYHGYPNHFQNLTLSGQRELFRRLGFEVLEAGVAVGPTYTLTHVVATYLALFVPRLPGVPLRALWLVVKELLKPLDLVLNRHPQAHVLASVTYVLVRKRPAFREESGEESAVAGVPVGGVS